MRKYLLIAFVGVFTFLSVSCERLFLDYNADTSPVAAFDAFWETLDQRYPYFDLKGVDWNNSYALHRPLVNNHMTGDELWTVMTDMLAELRDGHTNLANNDDFWTVFDDETLYPEPLFDFDLVSQNYLGSSVGYRGALAFGTVGALGYIYYEDLRSYVSGDNIDYIVDYFRDTDGIIIDIRNNMGGQSGYGDTILKRFLQETTLVERIFYKTGPGHNDFSDPVGYSLSPEGPYRYLKPVVMLINSKTFSAGTFFASRMSVLPQVTMIGEPTRGGAGSPRFIDLPNGWLLRYSSSFSLRADGYDIEKGVPVDYAVQMDESDFDGGIDSQLEYAIDFLLTL